MSNERKKNNNVQISWGRRTKVGFISDEMKATNLDHIFQALTPGSKIAIRTVQCTNKATGEPFESAVFEIISAEDVKKFNADNPARKPGSVPRNDTSSDFLT